MMQYQSMRMIVKLRKFWGITERQGFKIFKFYRLEGMHVYIHLDFIMYNKDKYCFPFKNT